MLFGGIPTEVPGGHGWRVRQVQIGRVVCAFQEVSGGLVLALEGEIGVVEVFGGRKRSFDTVN